MNQDLQHLKLLAIFHYVVGGFISLFGCLFLFYLGIGIAMLAGAFNNEPDAPPPEVGWIFVAVGTVAITFAWGLAIAVIVAGRKLHTQRSHTYCFVVACFECLWMPFGTVLGVFTIIVLSKPAVKALFGLPVEGNPAD